jgi:hypothetical protein
MTLLRRSIFFLFLLTGLSSCLRDRYAKIQYHDANFRLSHTSSPLRTDGYYLIERDAGYLFQKYGDTAAQLKRDTTYGYLQLFNDGYCVFGDWHGFYRKKDAVDLSVRSGNPYGYWGYYKIMDDTLRIEFLHAHPKIFRTVCYRSETWGLIRGGQLIFPQPEFMIWDCKAQFVPSPVCLDTASNFIKNKKLYRK